MKKLLLVAAIGVAGSMSASSFINNETQLKVNAENENSSIALMRDWKIEYGYGDDGSGCLVYGTYITGNNGVTLFTPCPSSRCVGFAEICPPEGGAFA